MSKNPIFRLAVLGWLLAQVPGAGAAERVDAAAGLTPEHHTVYTDDGVALAVRRYAHPHAQPVLLVHGLSANMNCFDLSLEGASLARFLAKRGFDVWLFNERGMGTGEWASDEPAGWHHTVDDLALLDLAAVIDYVRAETGGLKLVGLGHSMGGMLLSIYLEGGTYADAGGPGSSLIRLDSQLAAERNALFSGVVLMSSPVRLDWEAHPSVLTFLLYSYWDYNLLLTTMAESDLALAAARALDVLPSSELIQFLTQDIRSCPWVGNVLADFLIWVVSHVGDSYLLAEIFNPQNMNPTLNAAALQEVIDDTGGMVLEQFIDWVRGRTFREFYAARNPNPVVYADHFGALSTPLLVACGGRDKLANDGVIYNEGYKRYGSADKRFLRFEDRGHGDILVGTEVETKIFPPIRDWMLGHSATGTAAVR